MSKEKLSLDEIEQKLLEFVDPTGMTAHSVAVYSALVEIRKTRALETLADTANRPGGFRVTGDL